MVGRLCCRKLDIFFHYYVFLWYCCWPLMGMGCWARWTFDFTWHGHSILCIEDMTFELHFPGHRRVWRIFFLKWILLLQKLSKPFWNQRGRMWGNTLPEGRWREFQNPNSTDVRLACELIWCSPCTPRISPAPPLCDVRCTGSWEELGAGHGPVREGSTWGSWCHLSWCLKF